MLSMLDNPLSDAVARSGAVGAAGAVGSMVMESAGDAVDGLPATSLAVVVMLCTPAVMAGAGNDQVPAAVATAVPMSVAPS